MGTIFFKLSGYRKGEINIEIYEILSKKVTLIETIFFA